MFSSKTLLILGKMTPFQLFPLKNFRKMSNLRYRFLTQGYFTWNFIIFLFSMVSSLTSVINERHFSQIFRKQFSMKQEDEALSV